MLTVRTLLETTFTKYGEIVRELLNQGLAAKGSSLSPADFATEFASFSEPAGGAFMFATDMDTPVGVAGFRRLQDKTCLLAHFHIATAIDPRTPSVLLEQVFRKASRAGYDKIRITSERLSLRPILDFVIAHAKNTLQGRPLEFVPTQEFFDVPLV